MVMDSHYFWPFYKLCSWSSDMISNFNSEQPKRQNSKSNFNVGSFLGMLIQINYHLNYWFLSGKY